MHNIHHFRCLKYCNDFAFCYFYFIICLLFFFNKSSVQWGQWMPQGLIKLSAMSCIQHQNLKNHIWETQNHSCFWKPFIPQNLFVDTPRAYSLFYNQIKSHFSIAMATKSIKFVNKKIVWFYIKKSPTIYIERVKKEFLALGFYTLDSLYLLL